MFLLKKTSFLFTLTTYLIVLSLPLSSGAQSFDKKPYNRFQFHKYKWEVLHTKAFSIYFPIGYDSLCAFTARELPGAMELVKRRMGASLTKEPNVIIYPSVDQLYESNIGGFEIKDFTLPTIVHKGTRVMLPFSGSHIGLKEKLQEALVRVVWEEQFKNDLDAQLKGTAVGEKIPAWFSEGAISYFANGWSIEDEDALRRTFIAREYQNWQEVAAYNGRIAGAALCHYLSQQYYRQAVMQLFFQLRKKRSLPRAMRLIAKRPLDSVLADCLVFYRQRFYGSVGHSDTIQTTSVFPLIRGRLKSVLASPGGSQYAYIVATFKERSVWVYDQQSGKQTKDMSYKLPPWISNNTADPYPIVEWHSNGKDLLIAAPGKGKITIKRYTTSGGNMIQENTLYGVDGVNTMQSVGLNDLLLSAYRKGQSDVVKYDARRERYAAYTGYIHDDRDGVTGSDGWLYFISDRILKRENYSDKDSLYSANGIFRAKDGVIEPVVVDTLDFIKWNRLTGLGDGRMLATHTRFGMERFALINGNGTVTTLAPYEPFFLDRVKNTISFYRTENGSVRIQEHELQQWITSNAVTASDTSSPWLADYRSNAAERAKEDSILKAARSSEPSFLDGVLKPKNTRERSRQMKDSTYASLQYDPKKIRPYVLQLHSAYFTARVNNDYFINRYQPYTNYQGQFKFPEVGGMARGGFTDLFENHHFSIAYKMPAGTEGSDFFVRYENTARKTDWSLLWFRKVESLQPDPKRDWKDEHGRPYPNTAKVKTNYFELAVKKPVTYYLGTSFTTAVRQDRTIFLATEEYSLKFDDISSTWSISTAAATWNKLQPTLPFLYKGFRSRVVADLFKGFSQNTDGLYGIGADVEYHHPIYRHITAVGRFQAGHSGGSSKLLYNLGGIDNNLTVRTDSNVHFQQEAPYAFQTLVTPLRGHLQNSVYGNQYALFKADVYFSIFQSLIPIETPLPSINLLQLGLFTDMAYARETWQPDSKSTSVWSYGLSARTSLAGYPIRFDVAWPGKFIKPVWYLSLTTN